MTNLTLADGFSALNRGDLATAGEACKQALSHDPQLVPAHFLVGLVAVEGEAVASGSSANFGLGFLARFYRVD